jgi:hypothetical protein
VCKKETRQDTTGKIGQSPEIPTEEKISVPSKFSQP